MITKSDKIRFLKENQELARACFGSDSSDEGKRVDGWDAYVLIRRARVALRYSPKTYRLDIFYSLYRTWKREAKKCL